MTLGGGEDVAEENPPGPSGARRASRRSVGMICNDKLNWNQLRSVAVKRLGVRLARIAVVRPVVTDLTHDDICRHEPFRRGYDDTKNVHYLWRCTCPRGLQFGFCGHIFFVNTTTLLGKHRYHWSVIIKRWLEVVR